MIIQEVAPMLTCVQSNDGFQYELLVHANEGLPEITKLRIGPYFFKPDFQPKSGFLGFNTGGPESAMSLNTLTWPWERSTPIGWSRFRWEVATDEDGAPTYLVTTGVLKPGKSAMFRFTSMYHPGGLRTGLEVQRGSSKRDYGVTGPNYERFETGHDH